MVSARRPMPNPKPPASFDAHPYHGGAPVHDQDHLFLSRSGRPSALSAGSLPTLRPPDASKFNELEKGAITSAGIA